MKYYTEHTKPENEPNNAGSGIREIYKYVKNEKTGELEYKKTGSENVYEKIQASLEETKISNIIERALGGDITAINNGNAQYGDISELPRDINSASEMAKNTNKLATSLPEEIRQKILNGDDITKEDIEKAYNKTETTEKTTTTEKGDVINEQ
ncbi:MAG: hypothetical protein PUB18_00970 [bacterium]|nr:hypothetical protein [bacterium]